MHQKVDTIGGKQCIFCEKEGKAIIHEGFYFCGEEHQELFDRKIEEAKAKFNKIQKCYVCGRAVGDKGRSMIDCTGASPDRDFRPMKFCSEKCFARF